MEVDLHAILVIKNRDEILRNCKGLSTELRIKRDIHRKWRRNHYGGLLYLENNQKD